MKLQFLHQLCILRNQREDITRFLETLKSLLRFLHRHIHCALEVQESSKVDRGCSQFRVDISLDVDCLGNSSQYYLRVSSRCHLHLFGLEHVELCNNLILVGLL